MQDFLNTSAPPDGQSGVTILDHSPLYMEVLAPTADGSAWYSAYILRIDDSTAACVTNWEQRFDPFLAQLRNPKYGHIWADEFRKLMPTFFSVMDNTADERFGDGALTEIQDPLDMNRKWVIAAVLGGVDKADDQRVLGAVDHVIELSQNISRELGSAKLGGMAKRECSCEAELSAIEKAKNGRTNGETGSSGLSRYSASDTRFLIHTPRESFASPELPFCQTNVRPRLRRSRIQPTA